MTQLAPGNRPVVDLPDPPPARTARSLGWVVGWTALGVLVPGVGLLAAGRRSLGRTVLAASAGLLLVLLVAAAMIGDPTRALLDLAVDPARLQLVCGLVAVAAILLVLLLVATHLSLLELARLTPVQQVVSACLAVALAGLVLAPAVLLGRYARIQREVVSTVFVSGPRDVAVARPSVSRPDPWAGTPRVNVLLVGSDAGADRVGVRTDSVILASIDTVTGDTVLFSLPRNLERVPFAPGTPGRRAWPDGYSCADHSCLLNAIWTWAEGAPQYYPEHRYPRPGLAALRDAVAGVTGLPVDYDVVLNLQGFASFVNAIGGITVDVKQRLPIGGSSSNPRPTGWIEAGDHQRLDGYRALWFARSRWSTDDYDRMRRQRCVVGAIAEQAQPARLARTFPQLAAAARANIATDIQQQDLSAWVELGIRVKRADSVRSLPFTPQVIGSPSHPDYDRIRSLVTRSLRPPPVPATAADTSSSRAPSSPGPGSSPTPAKSVTEVC